MSASAARARPSWGPSYGEPRITTGLMRTARRSVAPVAQSVYVKEKCIYFPANNKTLTVPSAIFSAGLRPRSIPLSVY